jgi:NAD(P)H-nitrite reductase large subunit
MAHHVIVGASAAGCRAVDAIRSVDRACEITVVCKEPAPLYSRVGLTHFLDGTVKVEGMNMRDEKYFDRMNARILFGVSATQVNAKARTVALSNGQSLKYDTLLSASGSHAVIPPIPGADPKLKGLYACITREDSLAIDQAIGTAKHPVVIGAGLIGIQVVDALAKRKLKVLAVERLAHLMPLMVDATGAKIFDAVLQAAGCTVRTGVSASQIAAKNGAVAAVKLENGEEFPCDLLVMAAGVAPNIDYLDGTGVLVNRGVMVNAYQETNVPGIYAAGDVAETTDMLTGQRVVNAIWPEALNQGWIAGLNMAGVRHAYEGSMAMNTTSVLGVPVASLGLWNPDPGQAEVHSVLEERKQYYRKLVFRDDQLVGAVLVGKIEESGPLHNMIRTGTTFSLKKADLIPTPVMWSRVLRTNDQGRPGKAIPAASHQSPLPI